MDELTLDEAVDILENCKQAVRDTGLEDMYGEGKLNEFFSTVFKLLQFSDLM